MKERIFQHPFKFWAIRIKMDTEELWCDIYNIFNLFDECKDVDNVKLLKGDFMITRGEDNTYILYNHNQILFSSDKEKIMGHLGQIYYLPFYLRTESIVFFHGGCLLSPDQDYTYVFLAPTGIGKTTIISFLLANGYHYFSDDVIPVEEKSLTVFSFPKALYVRDKKIIDSFNQTGLIYNTGTKLSLIDERKYVYSVKNKVSKASSEVSKIFILDRQESCLNAQLEKISVQDSFFELMKNLKDPENMSKSYLTASHLVKNVDVFKLRYGNGVRQLQDVLELLSAERH